MMKKGKIKVYIYTRVSTAIQIDGYSLDPERWNGRATRDWSLPDTVYLNPDKVHEQSEEADDQMAVS